LISERHCKRCGKAITHKRAKLCSDCALFNRHAIASIHNGFLHGEFTVISDPSEYPLQQGLIMSGQEVKYMLINGTFAENTIIQRGSFKFNVVANKKRSKRFIQRLVAL
jgi:hypothetical protein